MDLSQSRLPMLPLGEGDELLRVQAGYKAQLDRLTASRDKTIKNNPGHIYRHFKLGAAAGGKPELTCNFCTTRLSTDNPITSLPRHLGSRNCNAAGKAARVRGWQVEGGMLTGRQAGGQGGSLMPAIDSVLVLSFTVCIRRLRRPLHQLIGDLLWWSNVTSALELLEPLCDIIHEVEADKPAISQMLPVWNSIINLAVDWMHRWGGGEIHRGAPPNERRFSAVLSPSQVGWTITPSKERVTYGGRGSPLPGLCCPPSWLATLELRFSRFPGRP